MSFKDFISEGKVSIEDIAEMTDSNDHSGALLAGAQYVGDKRLQKAFQAIKDLHEVERSMMPPLIKVRDYYRDQLMKLAKSKLSKEEYDAFYGVY